MSNTHIAATLIVEWNRLNKIKYCQRSDDLRARVDTVMASIEGILRHICGNEPVDKMIVDAMFACCEVKSAPYRDRTKHISVGHNKKYLQV